MAGHGELGGNTEHNEMTPEQKTAQAILEGLDFSSSIESDGVVLDSFLRERPQTEPTPLTPSTDPSYVQTGSNRLAEDTGWAGQPNITIN